MFDVDHKTPLIQDLFRNERRFHLGRGSIVIGGFIYVVGRKIYTRKVSIYSLVGALGGLEMREAKGIFSLGVTFSSSSSRSSRCL